ncbi:ArsB/NhaD family transporter [Paenibacillus sp. HJGM_3]|uniref:ArsB/NhaD family transporter n=1 Tax=Paenibacillus sp. HJGM_3 TaxID=3379816 RepID=UPI00385BEC87
MPDLALCATLTVLSVTVLFLIGRPGGWNPAIPTAAGAGLLLALGALPRPGLSPSLSIAGSAALTLLCTIMMALVLDSIGFFRWTAYNVIRRAQGSGIRLYWLIGLLCCLMTLCLNSEGSILITTPIIIRIGTLLNLQNRQKFPYLISGALVAIASSVPIGVGNLATLIGLRIIGMNLNTYAAQMLLPALLGIGAMAMLLFLLFRHAIPRRITLFLPPDTPVFPDHIPRAYYNPKTIDRWIHKGNSPPAASIDWSLFRAALAIVVLVRIGYYAGARIGIPPEWIAAAGAVSLLAIRWIRVGVGPTDLLRKTPWSMFVFAVSLYMVVDSVHRSDITGLPMQALKPYLEAGGLQTVMLAGFSAMLMSGLLNHLPAGMLSALSLSELGLDPGTLQLAYLANALGMEIGALLTPFGSVGLMLWLFLLRKHHVELSWKRAVWVMCVVVPISLAISLLGLYAGARWLTG